MRQTTRLILNDAARQAIRAFRDGKPWRGSVPERGGKLAALHRGLCRAYDLETMLLIDDAGTPAMDGFSGASGFDGRRNRIVLRGRLSVVTYLFCFAAAGGLDRAAALAWARETFAHFFPRSFAGCRVVRGLVVRAA